MIIKSFLRILMLFQTLRATFLSFFCMSKVKDIKSKESGENDFFHV